MKLIYWAFFIKKVKFSKLSADLRHAKRVSGRTTISLLADVLRCSSSHGFSFDDYFDFGFCTKSSSERETYISTAEHHQFYTQNNQREQIHLFRDKSAFCRKFRDYLGRSTCDLEDVSRAEAEQWMMEQGEFIAKPARGTIGIGVKKIRLEDGSGASQTYDDLMVGNSKFLEQVIVQVPQMASLHPASVNTVRVMTWAKDGQVRILGAMLRMGRGGVVIDNFSSGGIAALLDLTTGTAGPAYSRFFHEQPYEIHPATGVRIVGFKVPMWENILEFVRQAALVVPEVKTVGWDVAITENGPVLIEGNDNWDKTIWQVVGGIGCKHKLHNDQGHGG